MGLEDFKDSDDVEPSVVRSDAIPLGGWSSSEWDQIHVYLKSLKDETKRIRGDEPLDFPLIKDGLAIVMKPTDKVTLQSLKQAFGSIPAPSNRIKGSISKFLTNEEERQHVLDGHE